MADEYFQNARGGKIPARYVDDVKQERKGETLDGDPVYHTTYTVGGKHMSYDTVLVRGEHYYIHGSGHETDHRTGSVSSWDMAYTNKITWREAVSRRTQTLI